MGVDGPETAISIRNTEILLKEYSDRLAIKLTQFSAFGYVAVVITTSLLLEFLLIKFKEKWEILVDAFAGLFIWEGPGTQQVFSQSQTGSASGGIPARQNQSAEETVQEAGVPIPLGDVSREESGEVIGIRQTGFDMNEEVEVIGGNSIRVRMSQALQESDRFYVNSDGKVWDRKFYESLHSEDAEKGSKERRAA
jgi:hypothetical protein